MAGETTPGAGTTQTPAQTTTTTTTPAGEGTTQTPPAQQTQTTTTTEPKTTTQGGEPKGQTTEPADLEIKLPDGIVADTGLIDKFKPIAKELGLDSAKAQKLVDLYGEAVTGYSKRATEAHQQQVQNWLNESKTDKEFGGANFDPNLVTAKKAVERFGGQSLRDFFNQTGLGNHPALFRAFVQIGRSISEDKAGGKVDPPAPPPPSEAEMLAKRYPSMYNPDGSLK